MTRRIRASHALAAGSARHRQRRPDAPHRSRLRSAFVVGAAFVLGFTGAGAWALWSGATLVPDVIHTGYTHFAVGTPTGDGAPLSGPYATSFTLPTDGFGTESNPIQPGDTMAVPVQIDAVSQGDRGLAWTLDDVRIADPSATGYLASQLIAHALLVATPDTCTATATGTSLYHGALGDLAIADEVEIAPFDPGGTMEDPITQYLCLQLTLDPDLATTYRNVATVTGQGNGTAGDPVAVSASTDWNASIQPPAGATQPNVILTFDHLTFRGGQP